MAILIFDFDGTIHDSMCIYAPAVRACHDQLAEEGVLKPRDISDEKIRHYLGLTAWEMWQSFAPDLTVLQQQRGSEIIYQHMKNLAESGTARLYEGARDMLMRLKAEGHFLVFLSNCSKGYMNTHARLFNFAEIFDEMYCAEQFGWENKTAIIKELLPSWSRMKGQKIIAIGDRFKDMEIARASPDIRTVFCSYGFGTPQEGAGADETAASPDEIPACVERLLR